MEPLTARIIALIASIPPGRVATYGQIAALAGNPRAARQVVRVLASMSAGHNLPWHRVVNSRGEISLPEGGGREEQAERLEAEGVAVDARFRVDLERYLFGG